MSQKPVITVEDITKIALEERRPGCEKGLLHEDEPVQTAVYRVQPGSGVPTHLHAWVYDLFIGVTGTLEIRYEGEHGNGVFVLNPAVLSSAARRAARVIESEQDGRNGFSARASVAGRFRLRPGAVPHDRGSAAFLAAELSRAIFTAHEQLVSVEDKEAKDLCHQWTKIKLNVRALDYVHVIATEPSKALLYSRR